ncbi:MAG TPA: succinate dehydrogenase, hydrophobic membrane anchor protein [Oscillatoriaceae cyanobacterium]
MASYRTGLSRARGLGSAKHGVGSFLVERVTAIALVPLVLWAVYSGLYLSVQAYEGAVTWIRSPLNAVLLGLLVVTGFWHMHVGLRVVVEDYVEKPLGKSTLLLLNLFVCVLGGALGLFCILKVAFGGAY